MKKGRLHAYRLAANALHHNHDDAAPFRWLRACEQGIRELNLHQHAVGRTHAPLDPLNYAANLYNPTYSYAGIVGLWNVGVKVKL